PMRLSSFHSAAESSPTDCGLALLKPPANGRTAHQWPTSLIFRWINRRPRSLDKVDEASLQPLRLLVVAPECGSYLKFSTTGTDEFEEAIHRIPPVALWDQAGLRAKAAQST